MFSSQATASQLSWLRLTPNLATYTALMKAYAKAACSGSCKVTVLGTPSFRLEIFICRKQNTSRTLADLTRAARHNMTQWCKHLQAGWKLTIQLPTKETAKTWKMPLLIKRACNVWGPRSADGCFRLSANRQAHHPHKAEEVLDRLKAEGNKLYYSCTTVVQWKCVKYILNHLDTTRYYKKVRKHCKSTECMKGIRAMNKCNTKSQQRIAVKCVALWFQQPAPSTENVQHAGSGTDARLGTQCAELPHIDQCSQQGLTDSIAGVQHPGTQCMLYGHWHFLVEQFL